ncbi:hypothetical protein Hanom_Chr00s000004g01606201 [Helianthus anomalus]
MDADERLMALKKAYADIILNTEKEAAKRIMLSERKVMMDCKVWLKGVLKFWILISGVELDEFVCFGLRFEKGLGLCCFGVWFRFRFWL